ncbi:MAG: pyridoxamine 5'-phosphate oxidase family protein [Oscillospiraceae bacterium]|jgi:general stress protein 26|nr:pyridoxamine 5'-phosphate oxidase family protein [Oscillospiraceae bacterium]
MNEETIAKAAAFAASERNCVLALIDADGYPTAATITPSKTEGIERVCFGNNIGSNWAKRAAACGRASICFNSDSPERNVTLVGTIEIVTDDLALKKEMWCDWMNEYYSGPEDPRYWVLRFKTQRYSLYVDGTQAKGTL